MITRISPIERNDLPDVLKLAVQLGYPSDLSEIETRFEELSLLKHHEVYKFVSGEKLLGWIHLETVNDLIEETKLEIKALVVDENSRGKGVGHALIDFAKTRVKILGLDTLSLSCNILRTQTHEFYKREGFAVAKSSHFFELKL